MLIDIYYVLKMGEPYQDINAESIHEKKTSNPIIGNTFSKHLKNREIPAASMRRATLAHLRKRFDPEAIWHALHSQLCRPSPSSSIFLSLLGHVRQPIESSVPQPPWQ